MRQRDVKQHFGLAIKRWRNKAGISQEELAWRAGLHRSYVADIERGVRNASLQSIEKLARALEISVAALFEQFDASRALPSSSAASGQIVEMLLVAEQGAETDLMIEAFKKANVRNHISVANDPAAALAYLFGAEAVRKGELKNRPHLILLDFDLRGTGGAELLKTVKNDPRTRSIPVIVLVSARSRDRIRQTKPLGAEIYIEKPLDFVRFCEAVSQTACYWALFRPDDALTKAE